MQEYNMYDDDFDDFDDEEYEDLNSLRFPNMLDLYYQSDEALRLINRELENRLGGKKLTEISLTEMLLMKIALQLK